MEGKSLRPRLQILPRPIPAMGRQHANTIVTPLEEVAALVIDNGYVHSIVGPAGAK